MLGLSQHLGAPASLLLSPLVFLQLRRWPLFRSLPLTFCDSCLCPFPATALSNCDDLQIWGLWDFTLLLM